MPALLAAKKAVSDIDRKDINEMRAYANPPQLVLQVFGAVCLLFKKKETWDDSKRMMGEGDFVGNLINFKTETVTNQMLSKLRATYLSLPNFNKETAKSVSAALVSLVEWV